MKDNIWKKEFMAGDYKIKNLSLVNNMELSLINEEIRKFWKTEGETSLLDIELVKSESKDGKIKELLERIEVLLDEILVDDELKESIEPSQIFLLIPDIWYSVKLYKESLKKK
jgi:hypothetical protein